MVYNPKGALAHPLPAATKVVLDSAIGAPAHFAYVAVKGNIFLGEPHTREIEQGNINNCYLLAALLAIVENPQGSTFLNRMMIDLGNRVIVRLFHERQPIFYELEKTILQHQSGIIFKQSTSENRHKAPWVYFIEKAYAAYRKEYGGACYRPRAWKPARDNPRKKVLHYEPYRRPLNQVEALASGHSSDSFKILLGTDAELIAIQRDNMTNGQPLRALYEILSFMYPGSMTYGNATEFSSAERAAIKEVFASLKQDASTPDEAEKLMEEAARYFRQHITRETQAEFNLLFPGSDDTPRYEKVRYHILNLFPKFTGKARDSLLDYVKHNVARKRGIEYHIVRQVAQFNKIGAALATGKLVCIGSDSDIGRSDATFYGDRESQVKGLAGPHAYQVINCYERSGLKILLIRNPWHRYTRVYTEQTALYRTYDEEGPNGIGIYTTLKAHALKDGPFIPVRTDEPNHSMAIQMDRAEIDRLRLGNHGVFELILNDLTKRFDAIYICDPRTVWHW